MIIVKLILADSGSGWGYVSTENAESIKMGTDESIDGLSDALFDGIQHTKKVDDNGSSIIEQTIITNLFII